MFGESLRVVRRCKYGGRVVLEGERADGSVREIPAWMTESECASMPLGPPVVSLVALARLDLLLVEIEQHRHIGRTEPKEVDDEEE